MSDELEAAALTLRHAARATATARRMQGDVETVLLQSVVDAAASLFEAEAASIALFEPDPDRLVFRVAAGAQGAGVIGLSVSPDQGVAGHVFTTREAVSVVDLASDPRFDAGTARRTGYVPRSIAAAPLTDEGVTVGVLQVLDKRSAESFSPEDMRLLEVFARQAAAAVEAARVGRDPTRLWRSVLASAGAGELDEAGLDSLVGVCAAELADDRGPYWDLVDLVAQVRGAADVDLALVGEVLDAVARHRSHAADVGG